MINLIHFLTEELREIMASLGIRKVDDLIGNTKLLKPRKNQYWKTKNLDLNPILFSHLDKPKNYYNSSKQKDYLSGQLDYIILDKVKDTLENPSIKTNISIKIRKLVEIIAVPVAKPSRPSHQLKALIKPTMKKVVIKKLTTTDNSIFAKFE